MAGKGRFQAVIPSWKEKNSGFTLIELLISVVIIAVGILGVTAMQTSSLNSAILTRNTDNCVYLVSDVLDRINVNSNDISGYIGGAYGTDFQITPASGCSGYSSGDPQELCQSMLDMQFDSATLTVSFQNDVPITGLDTVNAVVTWNHKGASKQCQAMSVVPR